MMKWIKREMFAAITVKYRSVENIKKGRKKQVGKGKAPMPFYATYVGHIKNGVFETWDECRAEIHKKPKYKKFATRQEAERFNREGPFETPQGDFDIVVYTDGACRKNGKAGAVAGYGIYFGENDPRNVSARIMDKATNNIAELTAVCKTLELLEKDMKAGKRCVIYTDSTYAILCCGSYGERCEKKKWPDDIPNLQLVKKTYDLAKQHKDRLAFVHVAAHTEKTDVHSVGNSNADRLATQSIA
jgi:ribonuclease HI